MASRDVVSYETPLSRGMKILAGLFLALYLVWTLLPFVVMFVSSFKDLLEAFKLPEVGDWAGVAMFFDFTPTLTHYTTLFTENNFGQYIANSLIAAGGSAVISVIFGSLAAYSLSRVDFRGKSDLFFWIISTRMAPVVAVMVPLYAIFRSLDLVGTLPGLILAYTTFNLPFAIWILKGFFDNVPFAIEEAQMVDGATRFQAFRSILPLVAPASAPLWCCASCSPGTTSCSPRSSARAGPRPCRWRRANWCSRRTSSGARSWPRAWSPRHR